MTAKPLSPLEDPPSKEDDEVETSSGDETEDSSSEEDEPQPTKPTATPTKQDSDSESGETETDSSEEEDSDSEPPKNPSTAIASTVSKKKEPLSSSTVPSKPKEPLSSSTVPSKPKEPLYSSTVPTKPTATNQDSSSESGETETDSSEEEDSDSEPPKNTGSGKAIADTAAKKKEALSSSATLGTKRPSEGTSKGNGAAKRAKNDTTSGEDTKKPATWSEADEVALLQGIVDFEKKKGKSTSEATSGVYEFVKESISFPVSKTQFTDKRSKLKKKYMGQGKSGKQASFSKPHDLKCVALSKSIWGDEGIALQSAKSNGKSLGKTKKLEPVKQDLFSSVPNGKSVEEGDNKEAEKFDWFDNSFLVQAIARNGSDERTVKQGWRSAPVEAKKEIEEEMKAYRANEFKFAIVKTQFLNEAFSMLAEVMEQRGDI